MSTLIRPYRTEDQEAVSALWNDCFAYPAPHNDPDLSIRRKLAVQDGLFFVAEENGGIVGTVMAGWDGHRGWIYSLAVDPSRRRRGIGRSLVERAVAELKERDCPKVNLQVIGGNTAAVRFYEDLGFAVEDRISMGRKLYT